jgi:chromosome partitioning protein
LIHACRKERLLRKLVLLSRKGGTGKTTLSVNLAVAGLADGLSVAIADLDIQGSARSWADSRGADSPLVAAANGGSLFPFANAQERAGRDLLIMDTPAGDSQASAAAIRLADFAVLVCRPSYFDLAALVPSAQAVRAAGRPGLIVINQAPSRRGGVEAPAIARAVKAARELGFPIASVGLRARVAFQESLWRGQGVMEFEPRGPAAAEIDRLWQDVSDGLWPARLQQRASGQ